MSKAFAWKTAAICAALFFGLSACNKKEATDSETAANADSAAPAEVKLPAPDDLAQAPSDATTQDGVTWKILEAGKGTQKPRPFDRVTLHYTAWDSAGEVVESTQKRNAPRTSQLSRNIEGLVTAVSDMVAGEKRRVWIPEDKAYGPYPFGSKGQLVYDLTLINVVEGTEPLPAPADVAAAPADAKATASGLKYKVLKAGKKARPKASDKVKVNYTGWTTDGSMFDSSVTRGQPATFPLNRVIKGWTEGLQLMGEGAKARFWIPADLAYGDKPRSPGAPSGTLVFDVELLEIMKAPEPPKTPKDVAAAPGGAKKTDSGLAYRILSKGKENASPAATDKVTVHYSGWTTDGKMFDSSITRGQPASFPLNGVIKGWTEGLQLMAVGDKYRFWIPADLAYGENPGGGRPGGTLVFDVELLKIN